MYMFLKMLKGQAENRPEHVKSSAVRRASMHSFLAKQQPMPALCQQLPPRLATTAHCSRRRAAQPSLRQLPPTRLHPAAPVLATEVAGRVGRVGCGRKSAETLAKEKAALAAFLVRKYMAKRASWRERRAPPPTNYEAEVEYLGEKTREERDAEGREAAVELEHE
jgi:hypothetical protein